MSIPMWLCPDSRDSSKTGGEGLGRLIGRVIDELSGKGRLGKEEIEAAWKNSAGEAASRQSRPVAFKKSVLVVNVANSSWLYELTVRKKDIIEALRSELKGKKVEGLRFRIGDIRNH